MTTEARASSLRTKWTLAAPSDAAVETLCRELGISPLLAALLINRGHSDPAGARKFLNPSLDDLHDPFLMRGMDAAVTRILEAASRGERILIYGDYDVDGATSVIILRKVIELLGGSSVFHIPHRIIEGYGMREEVIDRAAAEGVGLVISVDTGIRARQVVEHANSLGLDCIITDHHLPEEEVPRALAVLNPNQPGCEYPDKNLCGVGVVFKLVDALMRRRGDPSRQRLLESFLKIVAIGTIADVVPLVGENRIIARFGLAGLRRPAHPGLKALIAVAGLDGRAISSGDVGFRIAPRLNAAGRMETANEVIRLFEEDGGEEVGKIAERLNQLNTDRQQAQERILTEIAERVAEHPELVEPSSLVFEGEGWHRGVVGIVAGRLLEQHHRPVLVASVEGEEAHASGRSISKFQLLDALDALHAETPDLFHRYGGHAVAVGLSMDRARLPEFRERLEARARALLTPEDLQPEVRLDRAVRFPDINATLINDLEKLAPFGMGNPSPVLAARDLEVVARPRVYKDRHLGLRLRQDGLVLEAMGWQKADLAPSLQPGAWVAAAFTVERNSFSDDSPMRLILRDLRIQSRMQSR